MPKVAPPDRVALVVTYLCRGCRRSWQQVYGRGERVYGQRVTDWNCAECLARRLGTLTFGRPTHGVAQTFVLALITVVGRRPVDHPPTGVPDA
jgi:hypothetical protein